MGGARVLRFERKDTWEGRWGGGVRKSNRVPEETGGEGREGERTEPAREGVRAKRQQKRQGDGVGGRGGKPHSLVLPFTFYDPLIALKSPSNHAANCVHQLHSCNIMNIP